MKRSFVLAALLFAGESSACSETGAFGVRFGEPVPTSAADKQRDGGSVQNAMGFFDGEVPEPMPGFRHGYGANRDRSFVYAVDAQRRFFDDQGVKDVRAAYTEALAKVKEEIAVIRKSWEEKYGLSFQRDHENGLSWTADGGTFTARIYVGFFYKLNVECSNKSLEARAIRAAMSSGF